MPTLEVLAYAKLNLSLDVLGRRPDGYHDMRMVMQTVALCDAIRLETGTGRPLSMRSSLGFLPADGRNLAAAAALALAEESGADYGGLSIALDKHIPVCAGMAGGSADAAAVLRGLNALSGLGLTPERLEEIGAKVGSDVPYCVRGGTVLAEGRGEVLTDLPPLPACWAVICKPPFPVSTPELFRALDALRIRRRPDTAGLIAALDAGDLAGVARRMYNVFEDALPPRRAGEIQRLKNELVQQGALGACMTGTGSAVFGLFGSEEAGSQAKKALEELCPVCFLAKTAGKLV